MQKIIKNPKQNHFVYIFYFSYSTCNKIDLAYLAPRGYDLGYTKYYTLVIVSYAWKLP